MCWFEERVKLIDAVNGNGKFQLKTLILIDLSFSSGLYNFTNHQILAFICFKKFDFIIYNKKLKKEQIILLMEPLLRSGKKSLPALLHCINFFKVFHLLFVSL